MDETVTLSVTELFNDVATVWQRIVSPRNKNSPKAVKDRSCSGFVSLSIQYDDML